MMTTFGLFAIIATLLQVQGSVLLPSQDLFYTPPSNISAYSPGGVIRVRTVSPLLSGLGQLPSTKVKAFYQVLYRTTGTLGDPVAAITSILVPLNLDPTKLLSYQTAYDTADPDAVPSYGFQAGANVTETSDIVFIIAALDAGWCVNSPDYEGLEARYTEGLIAGYSTLDSVRATLSLATMIGIYSDAKYAAWGYSGGSIASEWAAELQPNYAPELEFEGIALGGVIANVGNTLPTINKGLFAGLAFSGITGLSKGYPSLAQYVNQHLLPSKAAEFRGIGGDDLSSAASAGAFKNLYSYFDVGQGLLQDSTVQDVLARSGIMGRHGVPKPPLFVYKALADEISPVNDTTNLVTQLCNQGSIVEYHIDVLGGHVTEAVTGSASAFAWIRDRLNGVKLSRSKCTTEYVALSSSSISTSVAFGEVIIALLQSLL